MKPILSGPDSHRSRPGVRRACRACRALAPLLVWLGVARAPADPAAAGPVPAAHPPSPEDLARAAIVAAYPGQSYPAVERAAALARRPPALQPGAVPPGLKYQFADEAAVESAAQGIREHLLDPADHDASLWAKAVMIEAGAWMDFRSDRYLGRYHAIHFSARVKTPTGFVHVQQVILGDKGEIKELNAKLRHTIADAGGGTVRALRTDEMSILWRLVASDIAEPILVLETRDGTHRFILGFTQDGLGMIDDLAHLPPGVADSGD